MDGTMSNIPLDAISELFGGEENKKETIELTEDIFGETTEDGKEVVEEVVTKEDEVVVEPTTTPIQNLSPLAETAKTLLKSGTWEDFSIDYEGKHYENLEDFISNVEIDGELFKAIVEKQETHKLSNLEANSVRIDDLDETRANIVKAIASGVDAQTLLNINDNLIEPLKKADLSNENEAMSLIAKDLANKGYENDYINYKLHSLKESGDLTFEAEKVRNEYVNEFNTTMAQKQKELEELEVQKTEQVKQAKKEFGKELKEKNYPDTFRKQAVDLMYGKTNDVDNWVMQVKSIIAEKPEFKADFVHFIMNQEDFLKSKTADLRREEKIDKLINFEIVKSSNKNMSTSDLQKEDKDDLFSGGIVFNQI